MAHQELTTNEFQYVLDSIGKLDFRRISYNLQRDPEALADELAAYGVPRQLLLARVYWCNECCTWRTWYNRKGQCRVCELREARRKGWERFADAFSRAPKRVRDIYLQEDARRMPRKREDRPKAPPRAGFLDPAAPYFELRHIVDIEKWECRELGKEIDRDKQRLSRLRKHIGESPRRRIQEGPTSEAIP